VTTIRQKSRKPRSGCLVKQLRLCFSLPRDNYKSFRSRTSRSLQLRHPYAVVKLRVKKCCTNVLARPTVGLELTARWTQRSGVSYRQL